MWVKSKHLKLLIMQQKHIKIIFTCVLNIGKWVCLTNWWAANLEEMEVSNIARVCFIEFIVLSNWKKYVYNSQDNFVIINNVCIFVNHDESYQRIILICDIKQKLLK